MNIETDRYKLYQGDCLEIMDKLIEKDVKVNLILTDLPYGTTDCEWDSPIPFNEMWDRINMLTNDNTPIVLFGNEPFNSKLRLSNLELYRYDWVWDKINGANYLNVKYQPLKNFENIMIFSRGRVTNGKRKPIKYNPQGFIAMNEEKVNKSDYMGSYGSSSVKKGRHYRTSGKNYPKAIISFKRDNSKYHPTQKPVNLLEYLIKTYTNENDLVLDFTMGSGSTGVACLNTNRKFIGIELDEKYFNIAKERIRRNPKNLFIL